MLKIFYYTSHKWEIGYISQTDRKNYDTQYDMISNIKFHIFTWWRHQIETISALLALCAGNPSVTGEFPSQRPVTWSCDAFFDLHPNKRLSKQSWRGWFETPSRSLWRHCNEIYMLWWSCLAFVAAQLLCGIQHFKISICYCQNEKETIHH